MNYLKTADEIAAYCLRDVEVPEGQELQYANIASRMADEFCGRTLSVAYHILDFELSADQVGVVPVKPVIALAPTTLTTGLRIRPLGRTMNGGRRELGAWQDVTIADPLNDTINLKTGRIELGSVSTDFARSTNGSGASNYLVQIEIYGGFFVDTTLSASALVAANAVELDSVVGVSVGKVLQFNNVLTDYRVTSVNTITKIVGITPNLAAALASGVPATEKIPEDVKFAVAQIIEDRITYAPNTLRQTETLETLTDRLSRIGSAPLPLDAQRLLSKYRCMRS